MPSNIRFFAERVIIALSQDDAMLFNVPTTGRPEVLPMGVATEKLREALIDVLLDGEAWKS